MEVLEQLNHSNPQVASRLLTPLIQFSRLDDARRGVDSRPAGAADGIARVVSGSV
ncbi:aminopeptidase N C-terminal domain-containing protein [Oceanimonas sp. NS1]|nr:aminopeptidase N C-terminal domain-containing protein [Oceanimonas sp. NS1]